MLCSKDAIFKTVEVLIAIFITFTFLVVFIPQQREQASSATPPNVLVTLRDSDAFRNCVIQQNQTCLNQTIAGLLEDKYHFYINMSRDPNAIVQGLPQQRIYANSMYVAGNTTNSTSFVVRLYYWTKSGENQSRN